jgi:endonuclease YncB( thermonuclease family)
MTQLGPRSTVFIVTSCPPPLAALCGRGYRSPPRPGVFSSHMRWLLAFLVAQTHVAWAETLTGRVVKIADGDTLTLLTPDQRQHRIRLAGIDAPERKQPFGNRSRQNLAKLAHGKQVSADCPKRDRYGREVCKVYVGGEDVGLRQIYDGLAWWYRAYAHEQSSEDRQRYEFAEREARSRRWGLWADPSPAPPWKWRKTR